MADDEKSVKSAVVIIPPEGSPGWNKIQEIRDKHDDGYVRWMPHITLLYPFLPDTDSNFSEAATTFTKALAGSAPFRIRFTRQSFGFFNHKKTSSLWLKPLANDAATGVARHVAELQLGCSASGNETPGASCSCDNATVGKKTGKKQPPKFEPANVEHSQNVVDLQATLMQCFPQCNDVNTISQRGFQPHLSLGKFKTGVVDEFALRFQSEWEHEFEFDVKEVYLISRADFHDPFHIRYSVRLGDPA